MGDIGWYNCGSHDDPRDPDYEDHNVYEHYCDVCDSPIADGDGYVHIKGTTYCRECFLLNHSAAEIMDEFELWETA